MSASTWRFAFARLVLVVLACTAAVHTARAQEPADSSDVWVIETRDGNSYVGRILEQADGVIRVQTASLGVIAIREEDVTGMRRLSPHSLVEGEVWEENPQASRYFWAPNGHGMRTGSGYYQNVWVLFNQVSYAFSDVMTIGFGTVPLVLFGGVETPIWFTPKVSIPVVPDKVSLGVGTLIATVVGATTEFAGIAYGVATFGARDRNLSVGLGYGYQGSEWGRHPAIMIGGMRRVSRRGYLLMENYLIASPDESVGLFLLGGRYILERISIDYGGILPVAAGIDRPFVIPWLAIVVPFGER